MFLTLRNTAILIQSMRTLTDRLTSPSSMRIPVLPTIVLQVSVVLRRLKIPWNLLRNVIINFMNWIVLFQKLNFLFYLFMAHKTQTAGNVFLNWLFSSTIYALEMCQSRILLR